MIHHENLERLGKRATNVRDWSIWTAMRIIKRQSELNRAHPGFRRQTALAAHGCQRHQRWHGNMTTTTPHGVTFLGTSPPGTSCFPAGDRSATAACPGGRRSVAWLAGFPSWSSRVQRSYSPSQLGQSAHPRAGTGRHARACQRSASRSIYCRRFGRTQSHRHSLTRHLAWMYEFTQVTPRGRWKWRS